MTLLHKPVRMLVRVPGGVLAGAVFKRVWKLAAGEEEAPKAIGARRRWREVLLAATLLSAAFALVKAAVDGDAAEAAHKVTATWRGDQSE